MDIRIERGDLDKGIEALSSAAQSLRLTTFENLSYRALMFSVDVAVLAFGGCFAAVSFLDADSPKVQWVFVVLGTILIASLLVGLVSVLLNIPLFIRVFRESARLKNVGLNSLSRSLWVESRRYRWVSRIRSVLLIGFGVLLALEGIGMSIAGMLMSDGWVLLMTAPFLAIVAALFLAARYLRNQRERIDLTANAVELKKALQGLRKRAGDDAMVTVPFELMEDTARIESAQIIKERKDAVLKSITAPAKEYAVAFDREARDQRAKLGIADRVELEDLVERLSAEAEQQQSRAGADTGASSALRATTKSRRVGVDYLIDPASRHILVTALQWDERGLSGLSDGAGRV